MPHPRASAFPCLPERAAPAIAVARRKPSRAMLPLYAAVAVGAAALTAWAPALGAWPLLTVLFCPLLQLVPRPH